MSDKAEDIDESTKIGPGDLLAFGSINLLLTLKLDKNDLSKYQVNWEDFKSLNDIIFVRKHKHFWKKVELTSDNETMNILLNINKTSQKIIKIGYVGFKKMSFKDSQKDFKKFFFTITKQHGLFLTSCDICKCSISIQLLLKFGKEEKVFLLSGKSTPIKKEENKNNNKNETSDNNKKNQSDNQKNDNNQGNKNNDKEEKEENEKDDKNENEKTNKDNNENNENNEKKEDQKKEEINNNNNKDDNNKENNENAQKENEENKKESQDDKKENKDDSNEGKKDIISNIDGKDKDEINPFIYIAENNINAGAFNFIYFNFNDYITGEFQGKIKLEHLFEYFQDIKIRTKSKIILNFEEEAEVFKNKNKDEIFKDLLSITDLFIFYNKKKLYQVLRDLKGEEDKEEKEESYKLHLYEAKRKMIEKEQMKQKEEEWAKNYKTFLEKYDKEKKSPKHLRTEGSKTNNPNIYITQGTKSNIETNESLQLKSINQDIESKNESVSQNIYQIKTEESKDNYRDLMFKKSRSEPKKKQALMPIKPSDPKPLNKNDMFDYFKNGIFGRDPQKKPTDKIILVLEEFNKIYIVQCSKNEEKPLVLDFDLKLYPQVNMRNMNDVLEYKKFIKNNFRKYVDIFMGSLLSTITGNGKDGCNERSLFLGYLVATNIIKKVSEIERFNLILPKKKDFFYPSINKAELEKLIIEANLKRKERSFILDGNNKSHMIIKPYNPLLDSNLGSYLNSKNKKNHLQEQGIIGRNGKIMYDPLYRETLGFKAQKSPKNVYQNIKIHKLSKNKKFKQNANATNKFLAGFRVKSPGYSIYYQRQKNKTILPPINLKKETIQQVYKKIAIEEKSEDDSGINEGSGNISEIGNNESGNKNE